jgi:D-serine deaminase-like pyridoxal phosphate-dependent protein
MGQALTALGLGQGMGQGLGQGLGWEMMGTGGSGPGRRVWAVGAGAMVVGVGLGVGWWWWRGLWREAGRRKMRFDLAALQEVLRGERLPQMLCNVSVVDENVRAFAEVARRGGKTIRLATKSVRVPWLVWRALSVAPDVFQGLMCYSVDEAAWWVRRGVQDVLVAYPVAQLADVEQAVEVAGEQEQQRAEEGRAGGAGLCLMVDCAEHVALISRVADEAGVTVQVAIDVDASWRPLEGLVHVGAHRSPCRTVADVEALVACIEASRCVRLRGAMSYEAHVAGLPDRSPHDTPLFWALASALKAHSMRVLRAQRAAVRRVLERSCGGGHAGAAAERGPALPLLFNGGGSGSVEAAVADPSLTEVTVGSGIVQSSIFDNYQANFAQPAIAYALRVTRACDPGVVCCHGGGFVASGSHARDKQPLVAAPEHLEPFDAEGFGEVQTPLRDSARATRIGDVVLVRPAKAGEIAERFAEYLILHDDHAEIAHRVPTYRGLGLTFH